MIAKTSRAVVISTAHGLKFAEQKAAYHMGESAGVRAQAPNLPVELPADVERVKETIRVHADRLAAA